MKKVNVSTEQMGKFEGKWVAIDTDKQRIIAVGNTLQEIASFVSGKVGQEKKINAASFLVPRKDEQSYLIPSPLIRI